MRLPNVTYIRNIFDTESFILKIGYKVHFYFKYKKRIYNPLKGMWNRFLFNIDFDNNQPICFIFNERMLFLDNYGFVDYLKRKYPNSKFVCFLQDLSTTIQNVNLNIIFSKFDLSISYDEREASKLGIIYHPTPYSHFPFERSNTGKPSDVLFVGRAKNRLNDIIGVYEKLTQNGLTCEFYIFGVDPKEQLYPDEIRYNVLLSYEQNIERVLNTKCILEMLQRGAVGFSLRTWEAIMYDKLLLTNNKLIEQAPFYKSEFIHCYGDVSDLNLEFMKNLKREVNYNYKDKLSPFFLLDFLEKKLF
jgi:hypothetical protein